MFSLLGLHGLLVSGSDAGDSVVARDGSSLQTLPSDSKPDMVQVYLLVTSWRREQREASQLVFLLCFI